MIRQPEITTATLPNGMRVIDIAAPESATDLCGVFIGAGTRDEPESRHGLAHFVEHTIFKGTTRRRAWAINNRMEAVGGELNAFTSKEETFVYAVGPAGTSARATELVADLIANATFPGREIDIERSVICDEIDSYRDTPADAVYDDFEDRLFAGSSLGHNILGTRDSVSEITSEDCRRFIDIFYTPGRMVAFHIGRTGPSRFLRQAESAFSLINRPENPLQRHSPPEVTRFDTVERHDSHQANTVIGCRLPGRDSSDRAALALLTNIVGGPGMNSLLNYELRERRGLVYSVDASMTLYSDCGMFAVAYGCDPEDDRRCRDLVRKVLRNRLHDFLTPRRVSAAIKQYLGQLTVSSDNRESLAFRQARSMLYRGRPTESGETASEIASLTPASLGRVASEWLDPGRFSVHTII
ncbi:MAG: insulinase family protein [Clostridium sp.]|nr:insulinase family protein [Clostridium sp.]